MRTYKTKSGTRSASVDDGRLPNPRQEAFCQYFVFGNPKHDPSARKDDSRNPPDTRGNAAQSYILAGYKVSGAAARSGASRLLTSANIRERIAALHKEQERVVDAFITRWSCFLPDAQDVLVRAMRGEDISSVQLRAAEGAINQALGPPHLRFARKADNHDPEINITVWGGGGGTCRKCGGGLT